MPHLINNIPQPDMPPVSEIQATIQSFESMPDPNGRRPKGRTPQEVSFYQKLVASQQRIQMMPRMPCTVVNINPFPLMVNDPLFDGLKVEANKRDERYSALVLRDVKYIVDTGVDRNHAPVEFWPVQLAAEFDTQYKEKGGCFWLNGDLEKNPELELTDEFKDKYKRADRQLVAYCRRLKSAADGEWNTPNRSGARNIHTTHRTAAQILLDRKLIAALPEWMQGDVAIEDVTPDCPICKANTKKGQLVCQCSYVLDPAGALQAGAIDEHSTALERLSRATLDDLGVGAYVAETLEEAKDRRKKGLPKPLSLFEINQQKALDKEVRKQQKDAAKQQQGSEGTE